MSEPREIGLSQQPLTEAEGRFAREQIEQVSTAATFDEAIDQAIFTAMSMILLENLGQLQREMAEYNNS